jgi:hypothetical protein
LLTKVGPGPASTPVFVGRLLLSDHVRLQG